MRKLRIVIINRGRHKLFVEFKRCGCKDSGKITIKNRRVLKLDSGRYELYIGYENANLKIKSKLNGVKDLVEIPSIMNRKCNGNKMMIHDPEKSLRLICRETVSIANIVEKLA